MMDIVVTAADPPRAGYLLGRLRPWQRLGNRTADQIRFTRSWARSSASLQVVVQAHATHQLAHDARPGHRNTSAGTVLDPNSGTTRTPPDDKGTACTVGVKKDFPLGRWVHQQRKTLRAGELEERSKTLLDAPEAGMVWEPGEETWENKLAALRSYRRATGHLAPRQDAHWAKDDNNLIPIGQLMANLRRKDGLGKDPERAEARAAQLAAIDEDWNCPWPLNWQRHYAVLRDLAETEPGGVLPHIQPGVTFENDDIGKWLQRHARDWAQLTTKQQERLTALGVKPAERPAVAPAPAPAPTTKAAARGRASCRQPSSEA